MKKTTRDLLILAGLGFVIYHLSETTTTTKLNGLGFSLPAGYGWGQRASGNANNRPHPMSASAGIHTHHIFKSRTI